MVSINIGRKEAIFFGALIILFLAVGLGVAYGGTQPAVMGHSAGELDGVCLSDGTNCPAGLGGGATITELGSFGNWQVIGTNIAGNTNYGPAATDGFVTAHAWDGHLQGYTGSSSTPGRMVIRHNLYHSGSGSGITFPVKKGDYWRVETQGGDGLIDGLYWLPIETASIFGSRTSRDSSGTDLVINNVYLAESDGFIFVTEAGGPDIRILAGNTNPPTNVLAIHTWSSSTTYGSMSVPIAKDEYVRITGNAPAANPDIWWQPIGSGGLVKQ